MLINGYIGIAEEKDIPTLQHVKLVGALQAYGKRTDQSIIKGWLDEYCTHQYFQEQLEQGTKFLMLEQYGQVLAIASVDIEGKTAHFGNLYCLVTSLGLGSSLLMYREQLAMESGCEEAMAYVWPTNTSAMGFLIRYGFEPVGSQVDPVVGHRTIKFVKTLQM